MPSETSEALVQKLVVCDLLLRVTGSMLISEHLSLSDETVPRFEWRKTYQRVARDQAQE